ncbi:hypothetical protein [Listeria booriae]|uniref:hypothetical protein n=1 Tax=Listeria booriae TaxID=1552123 RepID=UPI001624FD20|nr:hypothetical protein [Listeria booriae]MBC1513709.1 hypothetical protein [Listeria booriae]MBC6152646.1 hypothetical protein [Listeria booriae]MBC6306404.1 hypothetical protein [Listeria booriae]
MLEVADNNKNGMQAMAVAPIKDGIADTSEVIIAYAGTDFDDNLDVLTDASTVMGGDMNLSIPQWGSAPKKTDGQAISAQEFATSIKNS